MDNILGILGIAKKAGFLEIGSDSVGWAAQSGKARLILSAADASEGSKNNARIYAENSGAEHVVVPYTKIELAGVIGRGTPGMAAITDIGMACGFISKLAAAYPERYSGAAGRLEEKYERIRKRRPGSQAHDRNNGTGKRRTKQ